MLTGFKFLVGSHKTKLFLNSYWEEKIFVNRENAKAELPFSTKDLEKIFSHTRLTNADFRLTNVDQKVMPFQYCSEDGSIDIQKAFFFFNRGSTIVLKGIENYNLWLRELCYEIKADLGNVKRLFINLYLTPENSQGFFHHYDTEDVFIVQIEGEKQWCLYDTPYPLPLEDKPFSTNNVKPSSEALKRILLKKGEVLYIPRGTIHEAKAQHKISCHLTISVIPFTWHDIITAHQGNLSDSNILFRKSIPARVNLKVAYQYLSKLHKLDRNLLSRVVETLNENYVNQAKNEFKIEGLLQNRNQLTMKSIINLNKRNYKGIHCFENNLVIEVAEIKISLPLEAKSIVDYILKKHKCKISEIPSKYSEEDTLFLIERLKRDAFITIA
jgi:hypothetical protein